MLTTSLYRKHRATLKAFMTSYLNTEKTSPFAIQLFKSIVRSSVQTSS
jgi:hypothetical protein